MQCRNSALCLFDKQPYQSDILSNTIVEYYPRNSISGDVPIEFDIKGGGDTYVDLNDINLKVVIKVTKVDGKDIDNSADKVTPINLPIASLFNDVSVTVGED